MSYLHDFWGMGGYAIYVWPSYAITLLILTLNILATWKGK